MGLLDGTNYKATKTIGCIKIDEVNKMFQINGKIVPNGKKTSLIGGAAKASLAIGTLGLSTLATSSKNKVGTKGWYSFSDLLNYDLLVDDSVITSGGVGQALVGGAIFGAAGAIAGGITGKKTQTKKIDSMTIKVTLNSFDAPCIMIPIITKSVKTKSKEYQDATKQAQQLLSVLDVISHNS